jgi:CheY-like chemotaxis protein
MRCLQQIMLKAFEIIQTQKPELVILDLNFSIDTSGKEGMSLLKQIRSYPCNLANYT